MVGRGSICAIYGCNNYKIQEKAKSFFRFPKNQNICSQWVLKSKRADLDEIFKTKGAQHMYSNYAVCSDHFEEKCFRNKNLFSQGIWPGAVPQLLLYKETPKPIRCNKRKRENSASESVEQVVEETVFETKAVNNSDLQNTNDSFNLLKIKYRNLQKLLSKYKTLNGMLKTQGNQSQKKKVKRIENSVCQGFFNLQKRQKGRKAKGRRYSEQDKNFALALHYCSSKSYRFLQKHFCLPSVRSLRKWLANIDVKPGINSSVLQLLKVKAEKLQNQEKVVSIVFDEMSLKEFLVYNSQNDLFEGFVDFGSVVVTSEKSPQLEIPQLCNQALVVLIKGVYINFKQIVGYFLSKDAMSGDKLKIILYNVITKIQQTGFIPKCIVCDQGSNNVRARKLWGVTSAKPYIEVDGEKIYCFYDPPHLIKSIRNNLKKFDIQHENKIYSWSHIVEFYNKDSNMVPRLAPKLTKKCMTLPPFSPMRVCLAVRVLSHSVACGILTHVSFNSLPPAAAYTAEFLELFDTLFDIFNSSLYNCAKEFKRPLSNKSNHFEKLEIIQKFLNKLEVLNPHKRNPICIQGWIDNITALKLLWAELDTKFNFEYLMTRRLTQDCAENLFSILRSKGGNNVCPDASKFRSAIRVVLTNQLLSPADDSNCEIDAATFLFQKKDLSRKKNQLNISMANTFHNKDVNVADDIPQKNADNYVMAWG